MPVTVQPSLWCRAVPGGVSRVESQAVWESSKGKGKPCLPPASTRGHSLVFRTAHTDISMLKKNKRTFPSQRASNMGRCKLTSVLRHSHTRCFTHRFIGSPPRAGHRLRSRTALMGPMALVLRTTHCLHTDSCKNRDSLLRRTIMLPFASPQSSSSPVRGQVFPFHEFHCALVTTLTTA